MLGLVLLKKFPPLNIISCQSVAMSGFVSTELLSSTSEKQLSVGTGLQQDDRSEPASLLHCFEEGN